MLSKSMQDALNRQVLMEAQSSQAYLAMASWADIQPGLKGVTKFFFKHSDEERMHMLKLVKFINERGGHGVIPALKAPSAKYKGVKELFQQVHDHEILVSTEINRLVDICLKEKDYTTHNFLQWYVSEQIEEEALARQIMDKLKLIGGDKSGLYMFDRDVSMMGSTGVGGPVRGAVVDGAQHPAGVDLDQPHRAAARGPDVGQVAGPAAVRPVPAVGPPPQ